MWGRLFEYMSYIYLNQYNILYIHIYQCGKDVYKLHQLAAPQASVCEAWDVQDKGGVCCNLEISTLRLVGKLWISKISKPQPGYQH